MRRDYKYLYQRASIPYIPGTVKYADSIWYTQPGWSGERSGDVSSQPATRRARLRLRGPVTTRRAGARRRARRHIRVAEGRKESFRNATRNPWRHG